jgi:hypothetical protein
MRLKDNAAEIIMPFLLSVLMTLIISLITSITSLGLARFTLGSWLSAWGLSWVIAFPTLLVVLPLVRKLTKIIIGWVNQW